MDKQYLLFFILFSFFIFCGYINEVKAINESEMKNYNFYCIYTRDSRGIGASIGKVNGSVRFYMNDNRGYYTNSKNNVSEIYSYQNDFDCPEVIYYTYHQTSKEYEFSISVPGILSFDNGYKQGKLFIEKSCYNEWDPDSDTGYTLDCETYSIPAGQVGGDYYFSENVDKYANDDGELKDSGDVNPGKNLLDTDWISGITGTANCKAIFGGANQEGSIFNLLKSYIFTPVRILTPIILIVLTSLDFAKAVFVDEKEGMAKAKANFLKRAVAALIIFLAPTIVSFLMTLLDAKVVGDCLDISIIENM